MRGAEALDARDRAPSCARTWSLTATFSGRGGRGDAVERAAVARLRPAARPSRTGTSGLVLRWPLYDPVVAARRGARPPRAPTSRAPTSPSLAQQETAAVQQAYVALEVAQAALVGLERAVEAARANYAQAEARFKAGPRNVARARRRRGGADRRGDPARGRAFDVAARAGAAGPVVRRRGAIDAR